MIAGLSVPAWPPKTARRTSRENNVEAPSGTGHLKKQTIGGEPAGKVQAILKIMGDRVDEPILELTQDRLLLLDKDGKTKYDWRRVRSKGAQKGPSWQSKHHDGRDLRGVVSVAGQGPPRAELPPQPSR
jgi:hypothetical protein